MIVKRNRYGSCGYLIIFTIVMLFPFRRIWSSLVTLFPSGVDSNSVTSSKTIFTKSSNPFSVPTISLSFFMMMWRRLPIALSTSSTKLSDIKGNCTSKQSIVYWLGLIISLQVNWTYYRLVAHSKLYVKFRYLPNGRSVDWLLVEDAAEVIFVNFLTFFFQFKCLLCCRFTSIALKSLFTVAYG